MCTAEGLPLTISKQDFSNDTRPKQKFSFTNAGRECLSGTKRNRSACRGPWGPLTQHHSAPSLPQASLPTSAPQHDKAAAAVPRDAHPTGVPTEVVPSKKLPKVTCNTSAPGYHIPWKSKRWREALVVVFQCFCEVPVATLRSLARTVCLNPAALSISHPANTTKPWSPKGRLFFIKGFSF